MGIRFSATSAVLDLGNENNSLRNRSAVAVSFWTKPSNGDTGAILHYSAANPDPSTSRFRVDSVSASATTSDVSSTVSNNDIGTVTFSTSSAPLSAGVWSHVVVQADFVNRIGEIYVNGIRLTRSALALTSGNTLDNDSMVAYVGSRDSFFSPYSGVVEDYRLYTQMLGSNAIASIYNSRGHDGIKNNLLTRFSLFGKNGQSIVSTAVPNLTGARGANFTAGNPNPAFYEGSVLSFRRKNLYG